MTDEPRYCKNCAEQIDPTMRYCPSCGGEIVWVTGEKPKPPPPPSPSRPGPFDPPGYGTPVTQEFLAEQRKAKELADAENSMYYGCGILVAIAFFVFMYVVFGYR